jgi:hypothetical protein
MRVFVEPCWSVIILPLHSTFRFPENLQTLDHHVDRTEKTFVSCHFDLCVRVIDTFCAALPFVYNFAAGAIAGEFPISIVQIVVNHNSRYL